MNIFNATSAIVTNMLNASENSTASNASSYTKPFDETGIILSAIIIFTFLVLGLIGNILTIAVITYYKELNENVFLRFIVSLCVSDLLSASISWLFLYRRTWGFNVWSPMPDVFCKFYWAADIMTSYVTAWHVFSFAILRFISIQVPVVYNRLKPIHGNIWMASIWIVCFIAGFLPCLFIFGVKTRDAAYRMQGNLPDARWPACTSLVEQLDRYYLYQKLGYSIFLYGPTVGVTVTCMATVTLVYMRSRKSPSSNKMKKQQRKETQAVIQLVLIIVSFLIGYIPFTAYEFWAVQDFPPLPYYQRADYWFGMTEYFFLRFSECLNPLFYNLGSRKVRSYTRKFLKENLGCSCLPEKTKSLERTRSSLSEPISTVGIGYV